MSWSIKENLRILILLSVLLSVTFLMRAQWWINLTCVATGYLFLLLPNAKDTARG